MLSQFALIRYIYLSKTLFTFITLYIYAKGKAIKCIMMSLISYIVKKGLVFSTKPTVGSWIRTSYIVGEVLFVSSKWQINGDNKQLEFLAYRQKSTIYCKHDEMWLSWCIENEIVCKNISTICYWLCKYRDNQRIDIWHFANFSEFLWYLYNNYISILQLNNLHVYVFEYTL